MLPLVRPALAALAVLVFTFIWNDYFWAIVLTQGAESQPVTAGITSFNAQYRAAYHLMSAGSIVAAMIGTHREADLTRVFSATATQHSFEVLRGAVQALLDNDLATGRSVLRNYVNATIGFRKLSDVTGLQEKSLMRMLSANGNPVASNLFAVIWALQEFNGVRLEVGNAAVFDRGDETAGGLTDAAERELGSSGHAAGQPMRSGNSRRGASGSRAS